MPKSSTCTIPGTPYFLLYQTPTLFRIFCPQIYFKSKKKSKKQNQTDKKLNRMCHKKKRSGAVEKTKNFLHYHFRERREKL